jgi:hypothetical protein
MKRINKNIVVFIISVFFLITGFSNRIFNHIKMDIKQLFTGNITISEFTKIIDDDTSDRLSYHDFLLDINSIKENILGTRIIKKEDATIIKADSGMLLTTQLKVDDNQLEQEISYIQKIKNYSEDNGSNFLYCSIPKKAFYEELPPNTSSFDILNKENLLNGLSAHNIPFVDFQYGLQKYQVKDVFFRTDHHWKPYSGFIATKVICEELKEKYGFQYNSEYININNYNVEVFHDYFLGSAGKKVGRFFDWQGADDIEIITPKFNTELSEERPLSEEERRCGKFDETVLFMERMIKDYYNTNPYATYGGGDYRLQIMTNNLNPYGKKILLIRDSFSGVIAPFLALQTRELHIIDDREGDYPEGDIVDIESYIREIQPDYVIVVK